MTLTVYSFLTSILWLGLFSVLMMALRRKDSFVLSFGLLPMLCLLVATLLRIFLPLEFPFTRVIGSTVFMPATLDALQRPAVWIGGESLSLSQLLMIVWMGGAVIQVLRSMWNAVRFQRTVLRYPRDLYAEKLVREITGRNVSVVKGSAGRTPYVVGLTKPVIVLPYGRYYPDKSLRFILMHEWQHFCNRDSWCKLLVQLLCCVFWWNPLAYLLQEQVIETLEQRCDFCVLARLTAGERRRYVQMLLGEKRMGRKESRTAAGSSPLAAGDSKNAFVTRLRLDAQYEKVQSRGKAGGIIVSILIGLLFVFSYTMVFQPYIDPTDTAGLISSTELPIGSYLIDNEDGTYSICIDGEYGIIDDITVEPFASMPIVRK